MPKYSNIRKSGLKKLSFWAVGIPCGINFIMRIFVTCFIVGEVIPCEERTAMYTVSEGLDFFKTSLDWLNITVDF